MNLKFALAMVATAAIAACGSSNETFTLSSGTNAYKLSDVHAQDPDNCDLAGVFADGDTIQVAVSGTTATFAFSSNTARQPAATISGNELQEGSKTYDVDYNTEPGLTSQFDCVETTTLTISGTLLADDKFSGQLIKQNVQKSGACDLSDLSSALGYKAFPCSSTLTFTAEKQ